MWIGAGIGGLNCLGNWHGSLLIWVGIGSRAGRRKPSLHGKRRNISLPIFVVYVLECEGPNSSEKFTLYPLWDKIKADEL